MEDEDYRVYHTEKLDNYRNAVWREMYYLKEQGGRKYKVTNGKLIARMNGDYIYSFEMESELHLGDDAPITLINSQNQKLDEGFVFICEDFQLIIIISKYFGQSIESGFVVVEPWKLLESLNNRLQYINPYSNSLAFKLLEDGPRLATGEPATAILKGQAIAKQKSLTSDITIIWGPPGTGKTYTMSETAIEFLNQGKSVLIVSHSNISVDGVVEKIYDLMNNKKMNDQLKSGKILRYGYVRDEKLKGNESIVSFDYTIKKFPELKKKMDELVKRMAELKSVSNEYNKEMLDLEKEIRNIKAQLKDAEKESVRKAKIVSTTISKVYADKLFEDRRYDVVMFDEVSMAYVPQLVFAASIAKTNFIAVGDFCQLPPIVQSDARKLLQKDIFNYLAITDGFGHVYNHPWLVMLNEQRRMHPDISRFPNNRVYHKLLLNHKDVESNRRDIVYTEPFEGFAMNYLDLTGTYCAATKNKDNSRFNILSAIISFGTALQFEKNFEEKHRGEQSVKAEENEDVVGIITPYNAQTRLIRAMILDNKKYIKTNISCATVHQFQGSEKDLIVFDAVESFPTSKAGWLMSKNENNSLTRLINVAVTRAKGKLVVVANSRFWLRLFEDTQHMFYLLTRYMLAKVNKNNVVTVEDNTLQDYLGSLDYGKKIKYYSDYDAAKDKLFQDIYTVKERIIISIPEGDSNTGVGYTILKALEWVKKKGITILIKYNSYSEIPYSLKQNCHQTENAVFPIILIDDKILWYGIPIVDGYFKYKNIRFKTICQTIYRITGEHTIDMITSLSELEKVDINDYGDDNTIGIGSYAKKYATCTSCGKHTDLKKSMKGKLYFKCPSCGNMDYLTPDFINDYIYSNNIRCPKDGNYIEAHLGKFGVYIKCEEGHYLKPDEI